MNELTDTLINTHENNGNSLIEDKEIYLNDISENEQKNKRSNKDDDEVTIISEDDENLEKSTIKVIEKEVIEPEKEIIPIILDKDLVQNNVEIIIDVEDIQTDKDNKLEKPSIIKTKIETTKVNTNIETPKQPFKGTKKRNPKYWKFDPDDEPVNNNAAPIVKQKHKRNMKYWKFDPDEFPLEQPSISAPTPKRRNPKYWKLDPEEEKLYYETEASKTEQIKPVPKRTKRNPKYWKFDPDEEDSEEKNEINEVKPVKNEDITKNLKSSSKQIFKGSKKRNPKYWKFDPDEFETEEIKKEQVTKKKRNPKYWKFDPDETFDDLKKPIEEKEVEKEIEKEVEKVVEKVNKYWKTNEPTENKIIVEKQDKEKTKNNKYWKTEEIDKQKDGIKEEDAISKKNKYWKKEEKPVDPIKEKLIETQRSMYWKLDDQIKLESKDEKITITEGQKFTNFYVILYFLHNYYCLL